MHAAKTDSPAPPRSDFSDRRTLLAYLRGEDDAGLFRLADRVRRDHSGDTVFIRGIVEFSSHCIRNCHYCGLRAPNTGLARYRMDPAEILESVRGLARFGIETTVLQSGDDPCFDRNRLCRVIRSIKREFPRMAVTLSVGERSRADYSAFREAGADRFLLKHETVNPGLYALRHPGQSHAVRFAILRLLRELGYQVGCGCLVGLPGQTEEDLVDEILFLRDFQPDMAGNGPFVPNAHTPLAAEPPGSVPVTLRMIALSRIVTRNAHLPATTALATLDPVNGYRRGLEAGANVIMIDATPGRYSGSYRIYDGKYRSGPEAVRALIESTGRRAGGERGDSFKKTRTGEPA